MSYESVVLKNLTGNLTGYYLLDALGTLVLTIVLGIIVYKIYKWFIDVLESSKSVSTASNHYRVHLYALKTGIVKKISEDNDIELMFAPSAPESDIIGDVYKKACDEVANDLK